VAAGAAAGGGVLGVQIEYDMVHLRTSLVEVVQIIELKRSSANN
jgi:hypothetical protein